MYVRTKDWIYDTENLHYRWIENNKVYKVGWDVEKPTFEGDIINQSENLAELCDEFIDEEQHYIIQNKEIIREIPNNQTLKNHTIYGAIWTDKGLIYVAKMNDKGELELI